MNPMRRISSLQEDFAKLGLAPKSESRAPVLSEGREQRQPRREDKRRPAKKVAPKKRAESKKFGMKVNSKVYESRLNTIATLHGSKTEKTAKLQESAQELRQRATLLESLRDLTAELRGGKTEQIVHGFKNVIGLAGTLLRKFAVVEEVMEDLGAPTIEHPGSAYPADKTVSNVAAKAKTGDAAETPTDVSAKSEEDDVEGNEDDFVGDMEGWEDDDEDEAAEEDDPEKKDDVGEQDERGAPGLSDTGEENEPEDETSEEDDVEMGEEGDEEETEKTTEEEDPEKKDDSTEEEDDVEKKDEPTSESMVVNMAKLRMEAEDVLARMKTSVLSPADAAAVLQDMVSYLGGALKVYLDVASEIAKYAYAGADAPQPVGATPAPVDNVNKYAGQDAPQPAVATPPVSAPVQ